MRGIRILTMSVALAALAAGLWLPVADGMGAAYAAQKRVRVSFPAAKDAKGVASELAGAADRRLGERIRSVEEYDDFRAWVAARGLDTKAVKESPHAWISYALGAEGLFGEEPAIRLGGGAAMRRSAGDAGSGTGMDVSVTVRDGRNAVFVDAGKVAGLFEATSDLQDWGGAAQLSATATQTGSDGTTLRFHVAPDVSAASAVFFRLALDPQGAASAGVRARAAKSKPIARSASLTLGTDTRGFTSDAANSKELSVTANVSWTAKSSASWLAVKTASGSGNGKIVYNVAANTGNSSRSATITVSGGGLTRKFTAIQNGKEGGLYMVVDLSAGSTAAWYPVSYLDAAPSGGWTDEYKTTKLVLRRIEAGTFTMGSPTSESGRTSNETQHKVKLSKPYYIGVFEVTQKQWKQVQGPSSNTSGFSGDKLPLEKVSWNEIRGSTGWPASPGVSALAFMGRLRARTGLTDFDLPTEAQWEYACRAGTTMAYAYGASEDGNYMWYTSNSSSKTHEVGTKKPNVWGLYDMHGNVWEWCLDWYGGDYDTVSATDPKGASSGEYRILRGGSWNSGASSCRSAHSGYETSSKAGNSQGFRIAKTSTATGGGGGSSATLTLGATSRSFTADAASSKEVSLTATVSWTAKSSASWLTVKTASGSGNGKIVYNVAANTGTSERTASITVSGGGKTATFTVTQSGKSGGGGSATLSLGASSRNFTADAASSKELSVTANVSWTAKSSASWLTVKTASGSGNGKIVYNVAANTGTSERTATITVSGGGKTATFTVKQSGSSGGGGGSATLSLGASSRSFTADAASSKEVAVTANVSWTAKSSASWLTVKTASGSGNGKIVYNVAANTGTASRTATLTVSGGGKTATFTVTQSGKSGGGGSATLSLGASSRTFTAAAASSKEVAVTATVSWTAKSSASWLTVKTASGSGNGKIVYNVAANTGTASRTATITVSGGGKTAVFTATQDGKAGDGALYMVVDLSAGSGASSYPVSYLNAVPSGGWTDEYKTTKLVLRRIEAGTFTMGSPEDEAERYDDETQHKVTLTKPYYIGVFEVTQKQYTLVMGSHSPEFSGNTLPEEKVSWNTLRGNSGWPSSSAVSAGSFMGRLRARTGLDGFDLPTESQWEYACRAGTTTAFHYGSTADGSYMWDDSNSDNETHEVGTKKPNAWGLHDMHGNVAEWCLDWTGWYETEALTDPKGASSGEYRVLRGGSIVASALWCRAAYRNCALPTDATFDTGFRVTRNP